MGDGRFAAGFRLCRRGWAVGARGAWRRGGGLGREYVAQRDLHAEGPDVDLGALLVEAHADNAAVAVEVAHADRVAGLQMHDALDPVAEFLLLLFEANAGSAGLILSA